ncbi:unnamed protein product [marine sediment metagenome]|uniref:Uncharacterized protein n=1 Tax=marine sediment metagenome TaxID=412755 RepID=X1BWT9_9ZZZZ
MRSAIQALKDVSKKLGIKRVRSDTYNLGTAQEIDASVFVIELEAVIMNSEWDHLNEKDLIQVLKVRLGSALDLRFDEDRLTGKHRS